MSLHNKYFGKNNKTKQQLSGYPSYLELCIVVFFFFCFFYCAYHETFTAFCHHVKENGYISKGNNSDLEIFASLFMWGLCLKVRNSFL